MAILCRSDKTIQFQRLVKCLYYNPACGMSSQTFLIKGGIKNFGSLLQRKQTHRFIFISYVIRWSHMETWVISVD